MSLGSTLKHVLGFAAGILIPGASKTAVDSIHAVQQELAELYGQAATKLAADLQSNTSLTGAAKVFGIAQSIVDKAKSQSWKGAESVLFIASLDVAQSTYRYSLPTIEADAKALLVSLHLAPRPRDSCRTDPAGGRARDRERGRRRDRCQRHSRARRRVSGTGIVREVSG